MRHAFRCTRSRLRVSRKTLQKAESPWSRTLADARLSRHDTSRGSALSLTALVRAHLRQLYVHDRPLVPASAPAVAHRNEHKQRTQPAHSRSTFRRGLLLKSAGNLAHRAYMRGVRNGMAPCAVATAIRRLRPGDHLRAGPPCLGEGRALAHAPSSLLGVTG